MGSIHKGDPTGLIRDGALTVLLGTKGDGSPGIYRLQIGDDLASRFREVIGKNLTTDEYVMRPYEAGYKPDSHEVCTLDLDDASEVKATVELVRQVRDAEVFTEQDDVFSLLRFCAVDVHAGKRRLTTFRSYDQKKVLGRGPQFAAMLRKGAYDRVKENVLLFDERVDCYEYEGTMFIWNIPSFQRMFGYLERLQAMADGAVTRIVRRVPIANEAEFREACTGQLTMMAKLAQISGRQYLKRVTMDDIKRVIEQFELQIDIDGSRGSEKLVFDRAPGRRWDILKLLDDDYLGSVMTSEKYEVNSKSAVRRKGRR